eukprot:11451520-Ditylum_brightwellii.AAC.2
MAFKWVGNKGLKEAAGTGLHRVAIRLLSAAVAVFANEKCGIWTCWGKKSAMAAMRCPHMDGI